MAAGRRSVVREAAAPHPKGRAAVWATLRSLRAQNLAATTGGIEKISYAPKRTIQSYLTALVAAGLVQVIHSAGKHRRYILREDGGPEPPRLRPDGTPVTQGDGRDRLWRTMKMLKVFTARDLAITASVEDGIVAESEAETYVRFLVRAGYVAVQTAAKPGRGGRTATYRFVRSTGPLAPMITRLKAVWDPNTGTIHWHAEPRA